MQKIALPLPPPPGLVAKSSLQQQFDFFAGEAIFLTAALPENVFVAFPEVYTYFVYQNVIM